MRFRLSIAMIIIFSATQLAANGVALGSPVTMTEAEQQVYLKVGYRINGTDYDIVTEMDPDIPMGLGDGDLAVSMQPNDYFFSSSASLTSRFGDTQVTVNGSSAVSAGWNIPPAGADEINGGVLSRFSLHFTADASSVYASVQGVISVSVDGYPLVYPEETFAYVRFSQVDPDGTPTLLWSETVSGAGFSVPHDGPQHGAPCAKR